MSDSRNAFGGIFALVFTAASIILPMYSAIVDFSRDKFMWAAIDITIFPIGMIRGLMYLFS